MKRSATRFASLSSIIVFLVLYFLPSDQLTAQIIGATDVGLQTAFQDTLFDHYKRGRATIAADFDLDGFTDFYVGNPGDESYILRNVPSPGSTPTFVLQQVLLVDSLAWGGVAFDYDNDGDYDLFITCGGNEGIGYDFLFRNDFILNGVPSGDLVFTDVTSIAGVAGPLPGAGGRSGGRPITVNQDDCCFLCGQPPPLLSPRRQGAPWIPTESLIPVRTASANAVVADYDQDGDDDVFVNGNIHYDADPNYPELIGRNTLWRNNGDGTFTDVTEESGLAVNLLSTRHSTFFDYDNDGDADLYENNFGEPNTLWGNNGDGTFTDVTTLVSAPGHDLHFPGKSFVSAAADLDNDGWEDLIGFMRGEGSGLEFYSDGHALFLNSQGVFKNVAASTIINDNYVTYDGVMGSMVGDVSGDGLPDIYVGNGSPQGGVADQFYLSVAGADSLTYVDGTSLIDFPATTPPGYPVPSYPYRTHGTAFVDIDNDGTLEIAVANGGPHSENSDYEEPDRLFKLQSGTPYKWFKVRPIGDGIRVAKDAVGTKIAVRVSNDSGNEWNVYRTLYAGSAFSAQNGFVLHFGLADADTIKSMTVRWPNGAQTTVNEGLSLNTSVTISMDNPTGVVIAGDGEPQAETGFKLHNCYPNPFNPTTTITYQLPVDAHVTLVVSDIMGKEVATLVDRREEAGSKSVTFDASNLASGVYFYRLQARDFVQTKKLLLMK